VVFPDRGFVRGERLQDFINLQLDNRSIEDLDKHYAAVATELASGKLVAFNRGNTGMAVRASSAVPGVFQPVAINGKEFVDGGVVSPVPVRVARSMGADIVIAVEVSRKPEFVDSLASTSDILAQSISIMSRTVSACEIVEADIIIRPDVSEFSATDFEHKSEAIARGGEAARSVMQSLRQVIEGKRREMAVRKTGASQPAKP
jgi:NTE family protein